MAAVKPVPEGYHTITPHLIVRDAARAIEFYKEAFGAVELGRAPTPGGGKLMHATIKIGDSMLMLADEFPEWGAVGPQSLGGCPTTIHIFTEDADALYARAIKAGATANMPPADAFWGDRYGKLTDPFGHQWSIATRKEEPTQEEMARRAEAFFASHGAEGQRAKSA